MREQIQAARQEQKPIDAEDIMTAMMGMMGQTAALDEKNMELFKQSAQWLFEKPKLENNS